MSIEVRVRSYEPTPTFARFHADNNLMRVLQGPYGTGKSVACIMEILFRAMDQPVVNGVRRSTWAVVRKFRSMLLSTTIPLWEDWTGTHVVRSSPAYCRIRTRLEDGSMLDLEVWFLSLQSDQEVRRLTSLNLTGAYVNEARELSHLLFMTTKDRTGRFPDVQSGGCTFAGLIADTNGPPTGSWLDRLCTVERPTELSFFQQPPALLKVVGLDGRTHWFPNPLAENVHNIPIGYRYWQNMIPGQSEDYLAVYVEGKAGNVFTGKPVYERYYSPSLHVSDTPLEVYRGLPLKFGFDLGLSPAGVMGQVTPQGQVRIYAEFLGQDEGVCQLAERLIRPALRSERFQGLPIDRSFVDPADPPSQGRKVTPSDELNLLGFRCRKAPSNLFTVRRNAVINMLERQQGGVPDLLIDPGCARLIAGFEGGYQYDRLPETTNRQAEYRDVPVKNEFSHVHDALQYLVLGEIGEAPTIDKPPAPPPRSSWAGHV